MIIHVDGDIFWTGADYICHQVNCSSQGGAAGIARVIFDKYPYSDCYLDRTEKSIPGTIQICGDKLINRGIINMFSQYYPGSVKELSTNDNENLRKKWFHECLTEIAKLEFGSIALPDHIGCNIAGGDWNWYLKQIEKFADYVEKKQSAKVLIYKLPGK